jgi:hypothetical protein
MRAIIPLALLMTAASALKGIDFQGPAADADFKAMVKNGQNFIVLRAL